MDVKIMDLCSEINQLIEQLRIMKSAHPEGQARQEEVIKMSKKAFRSFYVRPSYILKAIINIRTFEDIKRYFKGFKALVKGFI